MSPRTTQPSHHPRAYLDAAFLTTSMHARKLPEEGARTRNTQAVSSTTTWSPSWAYGSTHSASLSLHLAPPAHCPPISSSCTARTPPPFLFIQHRPHTAPLSLQLAPPAHHLLSLHLALPIQAHPACVAARTSSTV